MHLQLETALHVHMGIRLAEYVVASRCEAYRVASCSSFQFLWHLEVAEGDCWARACALRSFLSYPAAPACIVSGVAHNCN